MVRGGSHITDRSDSQSQSIASTGNTRGSVSPRGGRGGAGGTGVRDAQDVDLTIGHLSFINNHLMREIRHPRLHPQRLDNEPSSRCPRHRMSQLYYRRQSKWRMDGDAF